MRLPDGQANLKHEIERGELLYPQLDIESIFATQALAMGFLRYRARTRRKSDNKKAYGFALLDTNGSNDEAYDGSEEELLTCRIEKVTFDQWRMSIRFRHNLLTVATKDQSLVEDYRYDWLRNGNNQAWASTTEIDASGSDGSAHTMIDRHPIALDENNELRLRMHDVAHAANPLQPGSIYIPRRH